MHNHTFKINFDARRNANASQKEVEALKARLSAAMRKAAKSQLDKIGQTLPELIVNAAQTNAKLEVQKSRQLAEQAHAFGSQRLPISEFQSYPEAPGKDKEYTAAHIRWY